MISANMYKSFLSSRGNNQAQVKKNQSDLKMDYTFTRDPNYKRIYILTKDGWKFEDAKYQFHTTHSILKDDVDYYLQFRPKIHYPVGSYIIIPDDTDFNINLTDEQLKNPFLQPVNERTQWWLIVGRDDANAYVRYNVLKCNWNFKWVWDGEVKECFGIIRNANSYTSGKWTDEYTSSLDNLTGAWMPDIHFVYGDKCNELGLDDNRTVMHEQRFMITNNLLDPKVYQVTKIVDLSPQGIIKLSIKQDEYNYDTDNVDLQICDYYTSMGKTKVENTEDIIITSGEIKWMYINENNELDFVKSKNKIVKLHLGESSYFTFTNDNINIHWDLLLQNEEQYSEEEIDYYIGLFKMNLFDDNVLSLKPGKADSLIGKKFVLHAVNEKGISYSSIELEVA